MYIKFKYYKNETPVASGNIWLTATDMKNWSNEVLTEKIRFDDVIRHVSIVEIPVEELNKMKLNSNIQ